MPLSFPSSPAEAGGNRLISFIALKPGAGASTLACMAALSLASRGQDTALIDLNPDSKVRSYMGYPPDISTASILDIHGVDRPEAILAAGEKSHHQNLTVFPGVIQTLDARGITAPLQQKACISLKQTFPWTVAALGALHSPSWSAAILSDLVLLVMTPSRADMDSYRDQLELLLRLGVGGRIVTVLNKLSGPGSMEDRDARRFFAPDIEVPYEQRIIEGGNKRALSPGTQLSRTLLTAIKADVPGRAGMGQRLLQHWRQRRVAVL